jgi:ADP-ribose pyrophosphatase YjhB (NUDIX family)
MFEYPVARDGEEFAVHSNGADWLIAWHSPAAVPEGAPHGASAFCVTADNCVVLISDDGERWSWPGGRPEGDETWEETLRREVLEEACANVVNARLLGFLRLAHLSGPNQGLALVRSISHFASFPPEPADPPNMLPMFLSCGASSEGRGMESCQSGKFHFICELTRAETGKNLRSSASVTKHIRPINSIIY